MKSQPEPCSHPQRARTPARRFSRKGCGKKSDATTAPGGLFGRECAIQQRGQLLGRLEDKEDIADLERIRKGGLQVRKFSDFLMENDNAL